MSPETSVLLLSSETCVFLLSSDLFLKPTEDEFVYLIILLLISCNSFSSSFQKQTFTLPIKF